MNITAEEVKKLAELARLELTPVESERFAVTISAVLEYMSMLSEVDTSTVVPTYQVTGLIDVVREDMAVPSRVTPAELVGAFPVVERGELVVPGVFETKKS